MSKKYALLASLCVLLFALTISAQDEETNFSGNWLLDVSKSDLGERSRVESMTMNVRQTETDFSVERKTKMKEMENNGEGRGGGMGNGVGRGGGMGMRGGFGFSGDANLTYDLSGKETTSTIGEGDFTGNLTLKAKSEKDGKMKFIQMRNFETPMGSMSIKTVETWELSNDEKTLNIRSETETPRGNRNTKMVFTRENIVIKGTEDRDILFSSEDENTEKPSQPNAHPTIPNRISAGVVNGKALSLVKPVYPIEAREQGASGIVNVFVIIGKDGSITEAEATSGHNLLREAAVEAAKKSKFAPTLLQGQAVEVSGVIVYNFMK